MKIALIQIDSNYKPWSVEGIPNLLRQASNVDLIVFPECMPFDKTITHEEAVQLLEQASKSIANCSFISGGYIREGEDRSNRVYLTTNGKVTKWYDKQIQWGERIKRGDEAVCFEWGSKKCVPLICADAGDDLSARKVKMMADALDAGAGSSVPIVICSYGAGLMTDYWQPALRDWSKGCEAPVIICGIAGWHKTKSYEDYMGNKRPFGGGGSGVFWPDGYELQTSVEGIITIDLETRTMQHRAIENL